MPCVLSEQRSNSSSMYYDFFFNPGLEKAANNLAFSLVGVNEVKCVLDMLFPKCNFQFKREEILSIFDFLIKFFRAFYFCLSPTRYAF